MTRKLTVSLFIAGLLIAIVAASLQSVPGYMDADYYYAGALRLAAGQGGLEPYLWNYLNAPERLPAVAFAYWMPLVSLVAAGGLLLVPGLGFLGARLGFILLAALVPPITAHLSFRLTARPELARLSGLLALFPGFYLSYQTTTDAFSISMVLGGLFFLLTFGEIGWLSGKMIELRLFVLGLLAGLFHLARADGLLWLGGAGVVGLIWFARQRVSARTRWFRLVTMGGAVLLGYALVMAPWYLRNLREWGGLMPPGNSRAMWVTTYEETMIYPASLLTPQHWLSAGPGVHLLTRWDALVNHLQTALAVQGSIVLFPFILAGLWKLRDRTEVRLGVFLWLVTLAVMTLVFPLAGINGGFFHSGAAFQALFWAAAPLGIDALMSGYARWRHLSQPQSMVRFMSGVLVVTCVALSLVLYVQRVIGSEPGGWRLSASDRHYREVEQVLSNLGAQPGDAVLVNNPPGYWLASCRPAAVIPYGDEHMLLAAARQYEIRYVVLEVNNPHQLASLYHDGPSTTDLKHLADVGSTRIYQVMLPGTE